MIRKKLVNQKGSITLFVLLAMIFFIVIILNMTMNVANKKQSQISEYDKIKQEYEKNINNIDQVYNEVLQNEIWTTKILD